MSLDGEVATQFADELSDAPADQRVYRVALELYEPTRIAEIAARAECASDTARRHCERLADIGVISAETDDPTTYRRNESYFEWRRKNRLASLTQQQLQEELQTLINRERTFRERYGVSSPAAVDAVAVGDYEGVEEVWFDCSEWETVRRRIERLDAERRRRMEDESETNVA